MKKIKIIIPIILILLLTFSLTGCKDKKNNENVQNNENIQNEIESEVIENQYLLIDTENYEIKMDILGKWNTYSGKTDLRDGTVAFMIPGDSITDSPYFYITVNKYENVDNKPNKDYIVDILNAENEDLELESVYEFSNPTQVQLTYSLSEPKQTIKAYQVSFIQDDYVISYVYKSPSLLYIQEKGYIDDMIDSAKFTKK